MWARRGYRPYQVGLGVVRPALAYPSLRELTTSAISAPRPRAAPPRPSSSRSSPSLKQELLDGERPVVAGLPPLVETSGRASRAGRDRTSSSPRPCSSRRTRASPRRDGAVHRAPRPPRPRGARRQRPRACRAPCSRPSPTRTATASRTSTPSAASSARTARRSPSTRPSSSRADHRRGRRLRPIRRRPRATRTSTPRRRCSAGIVKSLVPLLDPTKLAAPGDANAWQKEHETLMYALAGAYLLSGQRVQATYDYATEGKGGKKVAYSGFDPSTSPLPDLLHAAGQVLADKDSDALLLSLLDLLQNHESTVARLMGAALDIRAISDAARHDRVVGPGDDGVARVRGADLGSDGAAGLADHPAPRAAPGPARGDRRPDRRHPVPATRMHMGDAIAQVRPASRTELIVQPARHALRRIAGRHQRPRGEPHRRPERRRPRAIRRRRSTTPCRSRATTCSCLQRSLELIHDANGGPACNKDGALVQATSPPLGPINLTGRSFPVPAYTECQLFEFPILANFYLDSLLPVRRTPSAASSSSRPQILQRPPRRPQRRRPDRGHRAPGSRATSPASRSTPSPTR